MTKTKQAFQAIAAVVFTALILLIFPASFVFAAGNQSNQSINQSALLVSPDPEQKINVYPKPDSHSSTLR